MNRLIITSFLVLVALAGSVTAMAYTGGKGECKEQKTCCKKETAMAASASCNTEAAATKKECCSKKEAAAAPASCHSEAEMNSASAKAKSCCKTK